MTPSRGLQAIRANAPRLYQQQCRNLSSRTLPRASTLSSPHSALRSSQWKALTPGAAFSLSAIRHASTIPTSPAPGPASAPQAPITEPASTAAASPTPYNLDTITLDDVQVAAASDSISSIPEGIGYLKIIGLDYGIGPTAMIEWTLEHMHIWAGLPWWGAIAATAILMRAVTFPLYLKASDQAARQSALVSVTKPIAERMTAAQKAGDQTGVMHAWSEMRETRKRAGLSYMEQFTPMIIQSVLGFCSFKLMRGMANLPVPGLKEGGFGWITDLTVSDGFLVLPALMAGATHMMMRYGGETGQSSELMNPGMKKFMLYGMPGMIFLVTGWQPGAVCIWFVASGGWAMGQAMLMQKPAVRNFFGLSPMHKAKKDEGREPGLMDFAMAGRHQGGRTINTTATSKPAPSPMSYQAPNIRTTQARGSNISRKASSETVATTVPPAEGVLGSLKGKWSATRDRINEMRVEQAQKSKKQNIDKAAADYEKRAQRKRDLGRRTR